MSRFSLFSLPLSKAKGKAEDKDTKKLKKFEKEEKEFRKKFKVIWLLSQFTFIIVHFLYIRSTLKPDLSYL